jgi:hypothetical protein
MMEGWKTEKLEGWINPTIHFLTFQPSSMNRRSNMPLSMNHRMNMPLLRSLGKRARGVASYRHGAPTELLKMVQGPKACVKQIEALHERLISLRWSLGEISGHAATKMTLVTEIQTGSLAQVTDSKACSALLPELDEELGASTAIDMALLRSFEDGSWLQSMCAATRGSP